MNKTNCILCVWFVCDNNRSQCGYFDNKKPLVKKMQSCPHIEIRKAIHNERKNNREQN